MTIRRREFVTGVSLASLGLSGCFGVNPGGTTDLSISNETSRERTATVRVTRRSHDEELLDETFTLRADASKTYEEVVSDAEVTVRLDVRDGPENAYDWYDGEADAHGLHVDIAADSITFSPGVA